MQTVSQATSIVTYVTGVNQARATQIARALIDAGVLPKSAGRDIKKISAAKLLPLLAAVSMTDKVAEAAAIANEFESMPFEGGDNEDQSEPALADIFARLIERGDIWKSARIEFHDQQGSYAATISGTVVGPKDTELDVSLQFYRKVKWGGFCQTSFTVSAQGVEILRNLFTRTDIEGMRFGPVVE